MMRATMTQRIGRKKYGKQLDHALVRAVVLLSIFAEFSGQASAIDVSTGVNTGLELQHFPVGDWSCKYRYSE